MNEADAGVRRQTANPLTEWLPVVVGNTVLRKFDCTDVDGFLEYRSDPIVARYQGWGVMSTEDAKSFVNDMASVSHFVPGGWIQLAIARADSNVIAGDVGIFIEPDYSESEIGFTLARSNQGRGHASRAIEAVLSLLWKLTPVQSVRAITDSRNIKSIRLLERMEFDKQSEYSAVFEGESCTELKYVKRRAL